MNEYGVTIIKENELYSIEVDSIENSETIKIYPNTFYTLREAKKYINNVVENEYNIINYHIKEL